VRVRDIDWESWRAKDPATLVFVVKDSSVLLIRKKCGLGAGKINAPGGRLEPGETPLEAAIRETREEVNLRVGITGILDAYSFPGTEVVVIVYAAEVLGGTLEAGALREFLASIASMMASQFTRKGVMLELKVDDALDSIYADGRKLRQILLNLLSNAVKFTSRNGRVQVTAQRQGDKAFRIVVSDDGIGIEEAV